MAGCGVAAECGQQGAVLTAHQHVMCSLLLIAFWRN
jgi:hypothetical protein